MKKILSIIAAVSLLAVLVLPAVSLAQDEKLNDCCRVRQTFKLGNAEYKNGDTVGSPDVTCTLKNGENGGAYHGVPNWGIVCMMSTVYTVTNWIFFIMTILAVLMIVYGGLTYITAAGDPAKAGKGKVILTYAVIGLAIALIAKLIPSLVRFIVGM